MSYNHKTTKYKGANQMEIITLNKVASKGITMGKVFMIKEIDLRPNPKGITDEQKDAELLKFDKALKKAQSEIEKLAAESDVFDGLCLLCKNAEFIDSVKSRIINENKNAELALEITKDEFTAMYESKNTDESHEKAADTRDISKRIMAFLKGVNLDGLSAASNDSIVVAKELTPSNKSDLEMGLVKGFITEHGGVTSHMSIIAKAMDIPAAVGVFDLFEKVNDGDEVILDCISGLLFINPDEKTTNTYNVKIEEYNEMRNELKTYSLMTAETVDGHKINVYANVDNVDDVKKAMLGGAEGIGLFRTEQVYMESIFDFPEEDDQFEIYKESVASANGNPVVIRTLDIGGDKDLPYYHFEKEDNPFLGWRALRIQLSMEDMFKSQLKAVLRASAFGKVKLMLPMVVSLEELRKCKELIEECKTELKNDSLDFDENLPVGIMIETPASVILVEDFAAEVDFLSIGTNDLTQYLLCVDRNNERIADMYESFHPAVLKSIKRVIDAGHKHGIKVGMCGEFAGVIKAMPLLLGMGLDEFSMQSNDIGEFKYHLRRTTFENAKKHAAEVLSKNTVKEIMATLL